MHLLTVFSAVAFGAPSNEVPIIGILAQEADSIKKYFPNENYTSFISATYVKFVEAAGARAVPIWINQTEEYYRNIVKYTNGILLPGGAVNFFDKGGYGDAANSLYKTAAEINQNGEYYPIIGICLGMEFLAVAGAGGKTPLAECSAEAVALPLKFNKGFRSSKLFKSAENNLIKILQNEAVTYNNHQFCVTPKNFSAFGLADDWNIISTSIDQRSLKFISAFEHKRYPFYGLQFHPEKNIFGHQMDANVPHTENAIKATQYFADFFVFESRKNGHAFESWKDEHKSLIYNYQPVFMNGKNSIYEQLYLFKW